MEGAEGFHGERRPALRVLWTLHGFSKQIVQLHVWPRVEPGSAGRRRECPTSWTELESELPEFRAAARAGLGHRRQGPECRSSGLWNRLRSFGHGRACELPLQSA